MRTFTFTINIKPKAKGRPRAGRNGMYTDAKTREHEEFIKQAYIESTGPKFDGPVELNATFYKDKIVVVVKELLDVESSLRGDVDNYLKSLLDGLNGVAYDDDKQVLNLKGYKR
jgi:Holliday junction resolvase RusA-like endonuclease